MEKRKFRLADVVLSVICVVFVAEAAAPERTSRSMPPQVPTRIKVSAPMLCSSSMAMEAEGPPMPVEHTETFSPSRVPV